MASSWARRFKLAGLVKKVRVSVVLRRRWRHTIYTRTGLAVVGLFIYRGYVFFDFG